MDIDSGRLEEVTTVAYGDGAVVSAAWPLSWSAVWVGALAAIALVVIFGLVGIAVGATHVGHRLGTWHDMGFLTLAWSVFGAFISFVVGGWAAARVAGLRRSETAMLHGAIAWLVGVPILLVLASLGATAYLGTWYGGLAGTPAWAVQAAVEQGVDPAIAARNAALAAVAALLLGLVGAAVGGWMGSGEPMTFTYYRRRPARPGTGGW